METVPGSDDIRKQVLISQIVETQGFILLVSSFLKRFGILDPKSFQQGQVQTQGSMGMIVSLLNVQARAINSLGLDSKAQEALNLGKYIETRDREREEKA
jgi:hypothetical protein